METSSSFTSYGECRCCLAQGYHRDITKEYYYNNIREVYDEIFKECFNLSLTTHTHISTLICSTCVQRLRDATSFRMMVVSTETHLLEVAFARDNKDTVFVNVTIDDDYTEEIKTEVKTENSDTEFGFEQGTLDHDDDDVSFEINCNSFDESDDVSEDLDQLDLVDGETELLARFSAEELRPLPSRCSLLSICPNYEEYLKKLGDKIITPKSIEKLLQKPMLDDKFITEKRAHAINATALFEHSNATAFKTKMRNGFPCFYCRQIYNPEALREHQNTHPKTQLYKLLLKYTADCLVVYADVTNLKCTICDQNIKNLNELKSHLIEKHDKKIYLNYPDRVIPFKLKEKDFDCQVCGVVFETFGAIERHMNKHYGHYICEECGAGFVTKHRLVIHAYSLHKQGNHPCDICKKTFPTQLKYKIHYDAVHKMLKKNKCPKCPEKFIDYFTRQKHLVEVHGEDPILYKCNICDKGFNRRYSLSSHMKRTHLEQKDVKCEFCSYMCYTKSELREHMVKHGAARRFECELCKNRFSRKKSLIGHMRIHNDDRRFRCSVCDVAFVHKCSLKGHMKSHEMDLNT